MGIGKGLGRAWETWMRHLIQWKEGQSLARYIHISVGQYKLGIRPYHFDLHADIKTISTTHTIVCLGGHVIVHSYCLWVDPLVMRHSCSCSCRCSDRWANKHFHHGRGICCPRLPCNEKSLRWGKLMMIDGTALEMRWGWGGKVELAKGG